MHLNTSSEIHNAKTFGVKYLVPNLFDMVGGIKQALRLN